MKAFNLLILFTVVSILTSLVYSIAGVVAPETILPSGIPINDGTFIFACYGLARTIPLAVLIIILAIRKNKEAFYILAILAGCIQFLDAFVGLYQKDILKTGGPFCLAFMQFVLVYWTKKKSD